MQRKILQTVFHAALLAALAFISSCSTIEYRSIQDDFVAAVAADNAWSTSPLGANVSEELYRSIHTELTDKYIGKLDERLQANAWLLRAVSAWRLGRLEDARSSAATGETKLLPEQQGSRDHVMLSMMDGMVIDSDLRTEFRRCGEVVTLAIYQETFEADFLTALESLDKGYANAGPATPPEVGWYYHYQRWRLIQNLRTVINQIKPDPDRITAKESAESHFEEGDLKDAADADRNAIPPNHPLHQLTLALEE